MILMKKCVLKQLFSFGYKVRRKHPSLPTDTAEGFPDYLKEAQKLGMDVNDYEEKQLGWLEALPILEEFVFPYLNSNALVYEIGTSCDVFSLLLFFFVDMLASYVIAENSTLVFVWFAFWGLLCDEFYM